MTRRTAEEVQALIDIAGREVGAGRHARTLTAVRAKAPRRATSAGCLDEQWELYRQTLVELADATDIASTVDAADSAVRQLRSSGDIDAQSQPILAALADPDAAEILEMALEHVAQVDPELLTILRDRILPTVHRAPVGEELRSMS